MTARIAAGTNMRNVVGILKLSPGPARAAAHY